MGDKPTTEETAGVVELRGHTPDSLEPLLRWKNDPEIQRLSDDGPYTTFTREQAESTLRRWSQPSEDIVHFALGLRGEPAPIGFIHLAMIEPEHKRCRLGLVVGEKHLWGRGYGRQAVSLAVDYAFDELDLERITGEVYADNERSIRMLESSGFKLEGVMRESVRRGTVAVDELIFGILRKERP